MDIVVDIAAAETSHPQNPATNSSPPQTVPAETTAKTIEPVGSDTVEEGYDFSPESSEDSDHVGVFDSPDIDDKSDVHEEVKTFRAERRAYK
ncbi:hypothetical protein K7X08_000885 [Anisodus acutangulus]|uniref:Uncharacterized protein n=1 Tax=Anisodus acutangulus TaxID=402998 RepID=A0A9Q1RK31_9SOLA|nr:hypothetical protein K7X08_000885 [Anisodus acutangulus]